MDSMWNLDHQLDSLQLMKFIGLLKICESINYVFAIMLLSDICKLASRLTHEQKESILMSIQ